MAEIIPLPANPHPEPAPSDVLWRHLAGARLRRMRQERGETLAQVARRAGVSVQYLSEVERGRKEPSSEIVAAVLGALDGTLLDLTEGVVADLRPRGARVPAALRSGPQVGLSLVA